MRHYISLGLIILLSSCSITQNHYPQTVHSWRGGNDQNLINKWGRPDQLMTSQNGNTVLLYKASSYRPGVGSPNAGAPCVALFEVNKKGVIVDAKYQGKRCFADASFAYYKSNQAKGTTV